MTRVLNKICAWLAAHPALLMVLTLAAAGAVRLVLTTARWINPDEGAHLLDGRFIWQGLQPIIDYGSRQPFYAYVLALFIRIFGLSLSAGRLMPLLASLGIGWAIYAIGARLYGPMRGWLAAAIYLFLPFTLIWSTVVKTEMLAVVLSCLGAWFLLRAIREPGMWSFFILSGIMAALAYYVRQSTLYMPLATGLFLLFQRNEGVGPSRWRRLALYAAGYFGVCLLAAWYYWGPLSGRELLFSQVNPFNLVWNRLAHTLGILPAELRVVDSDGFRILDQDPAYTLAAWRDSILFALFIIVAALYSLRQSRAERPPQKEPFRIFIWLWLVILLLAYAFQSASRGFYSQYFLEALPALLLLAAGALPAAKDPAQYLKHFVAFSALYAALFLVSRLTWRLQLSWMIYVAAGIGLILLLNGFLSWRKREPLRMAPILMAAAFIISASWSGTLITPKYECVWSPQTLARVEKLLRQEGKPADVVLSGAMIWTYSARMQPFDGVSHPTIFFMKYDAGFAARFMANPPDFIILDGYTQKKFSRYWPFIEKSLSEHYYRMQIFSGSKWTVEVWRLQQSPVLPDAEMAHAGQKTGDNLLTRGERI